MQLKVKRSQRDGGLTGKTVIFCLDARAEFTPAERQSITRYKLQSLVIYNSDAKQRAVEASALAGANARSQGIDVGSVDGLLTSATAKLGQGLKAAALGAVSVMRLSITIASLERGQHIECKSMDELLGAENAVVEACENLRTYLDTAASFDGREVVIDFSTEAPRIVAQATTPAPMLAVPPPVPALAATPAVESMSEGATFPEHREEAYVPGAGFASASAWGDSFDIMEWWSTLERDKKIALALAVVFVLFLLRSCVG